MAEAAQSVRESITAAIAEHEPAVERVEPARVEAVEPAAAEPKSDRARDEHGRFARGDKAEAKGAIVKAVKAEAPAVEPEPVIEAPKPTKAPPSSWKKDFHEHWSKFDPAVQDYVLQRESEFAKGVSTYKAEADKARELNDAMVAYQPWLTAQNVQPAEVVKRALGLHYTLMNAGPAQKVQMLGQLMRDYQIDPTWLGIGANGQQPPQVDPNVQWLTQQVNQLRQTIQQSQTASERAQQAQVDAEIEQFKAQAGHEHFDAVRETMAGLLQAGLADTLADAYQAAIRHPKHAEIFDAMQKQQRDAEDARRAKEAAEKAARARQAAVSPRSSSPTGSTAKATEGQKSIRDTITEQVAAIGGRL